MSSVEEGGRERAVAQDEGVNTMTKRELPDGLIELKTEGKPVYSPHDVCPGPCGQVLVDGGAETAGPLYDERGNQASLDYKTGQPVGIVIRCTSCGACWAGEATTTRRGD